MRTVYMIPTTDLPAAFATVNELNSRGARIINVDRNMVSCQGRISEENEIWFEHDLATDPDWRASVRRSAERRIKEGEVHEWGAPPSSGSDS